jgi:hypothetical protein
MPDPQDYAAPEQGDALGLPPDLAARLRDLSLAPGGPAAPVPAAPPPGPAAPSPGSAAPPAAAPPSGGADAANLNYVKDDAEFAHFLQNGPGAPPPAGVGPSGMPEPQSRRTASGILTYLPELPPGVKPKWNSAEEIQNEIERNSFLGLDTAALSDEKRRYLDGTVDHSDGVPRAIPGGPLDTPEKVRQAQAGAYGTAAGPAPLELVDVPVKDNATGQIFTQKMRRSDIPGFFANNPQFSMSGGGAPGQPGAGISPGRTPVMTPEQVKANEALGDRQQQIINAGTKAPELLGRLQIMRNAATTFNVSPFGGPGPSAETRLDLAKKFADLGNQMGFQVSPGMQQMITSGDVINKEGGQLVADLVRSLGSREAYQVWNSVGRYMPSLQMSNGGFNAIVNSIEQGAQRDQDLYNFRDEWLAPAGAPGATKNSGHNSIDGMERAFNALHPIETYASKVLPIPVGSAQGDFKPGAIYLNANGKQAMRMTPEQAQQMPGGGQWYPMN